MCGSQADVDGCGKPCPNRDPIPGPSSPYAIHYTDWAIPAQQLPVHNVQSNFNVHMTLVLTFWSLTTYIYVVPQR